MPLVSFGAKDTPLIRIESPSRCGLEGAKKAVSAANLATIISALGVERLREREASSVVFQTRDPSRVRCRRGGECSARGPGLGKIPGPRSEVSPSLFSYLLGIILSTDLKRTPTTARDVRPLECHILTRNVRAQVENSHDT